MTGPAPLVHEFVRHPVRRPGYFRCGVTTRPVDGSVDVSRVTCPDCLAAQADELRRVFGVRAPDADR